MAWTYLAAGNPWKLAQTRGEHIRRGVAETTKCGGLHFVEGIRVHFEFISKIFIIYEVDLSAYWLRFLATYGAQQIRSRQDLYLVTNYKLRNQLSFRRIRANRSRTRSASYRLAHLRPGIPPL